MDLYSEALKRFQELLTEAGKTGLRDAAVMTLATVDERGRPSARTVFLEAADEQGFVFFTNRHSRKGRQLAANPQAAMCFFWQPLRQQVQVEGTVEQLAEAQADAWWAGRDRDTQLVAWASRQSAPLESNEALKQRLTEIRQRFDFQRQVPRPSWWSGFRLVPERIEFWRAGWHHLHERVCYQKSAGAWSVTLLNP
ncbi:MAG: pyridoxamine 5'-phosphate oxidase [Pseudomonadota bacterium]|nr:pyridoxamine 5'-phosphate oxidase [Pseudomonadota bacterium]